MQDFSDYRVAEQAVWDPRTPASMLMLIAQYHPSLRAAVSHHPNADSVLLEMLSNSAIPPIGLSARDQAGSSVPSEPDPGEAPSDQPPPKRRPTGLIISIIVLVVALVVGTIIGVNLFGEPGTTPPESTTPIDTEPRTTEPTRPGSIGAEIYTFGGTDGDGFEGIALDSEGVVYAGGMVDSRDGDFAGFSGMFAGAWVVIDTQGKSTVTQVDAYTPLATIKDGEFVATGLHTLAAVDRHGSILWSYQGPTSEPLFMGAAVAPDGSVAAVSSNSDSDNIVVLLNADGTLRWSRNYGGYDVWAGLFYDVAFFKDGSLGVVGGSYGGGSHQGADKDGALFVTINPQGDITSVVNLAGDAQALYAASASPDGTVVAVGNTPPSESSETRDGLAVKFTAGGDIQWMKAYGGLNADFFNNVAVDSGGRIFIAGSTMSLDGDFYERPVQGIQGGNDAVIVHLGSDGLLVWAQVWAGSGNEDLRSIAVNEGKVCAAGNTISTDGAFTGTTGEQDALVICVTQA